MTKRMTHNLRFLLIPAFMLLMHVAYTQTTVRGIVTDDEGNRLAGVSITSKEAPVVSSVSDEKGHFSLTLRPSHTTVVFNSVGFIRQEVLLGERSTIDVILQQVTTSLDEVVVTGYTSTARKDLTGSVGTVNIQELQKAPVRSFEEALAGRVAGVQVVSNDGKPGSGITINIRGVGSVSQSNAPLYVIDGLAIENPDNNLIDPDDIESITVLKDASSTAIYGARGSNGVIVITTKRGQAGEARVNYNVNYGINQPVKYMKLLSPYEYVKLLSEQLGVSENPYLRDDQTLEDYRHVRGTDWQDRLLQTGSQQNHSLRISGGGQGTRYSISGNLLDQQGIIIASGYTRYQGKMTLDQQVGKRAKVGGFITYTAAKVAGRNPTGSNAENLFYHAYIYRPIPLPGVNLVEFEDELYDPSNEADDYRVNPVLSAEHEIRNNIRSNTIGSVYLDYNILKNLKLSLRGSMNSDVRRAEVFNGSKTRTGGPNSTNQINGSLNNFKVDVYDNTNLLEYKVAPSKRHHLSMLLGTSFQKEISRGYGYSATRIPDESMGLSGIDAGDIGLSPTGYINENALLSGFGNADYIFDGKYYLTVNFRADGSSKFVGKNRWGYFPSAALKWKFSEEKIFKNQSILSDGNVRFSYGETGNNRVGDFATYARIQFQRPLYLYGVSQGNSAVTTSMANPSLRWETSVSTNLGVDLSFLDSRLGVTVDMYRKDTRDLLYRADLPGSSGYASSVKNIASISNRGLEIALTADLVRGRSFSYSSSFNISFNRNRLLALADPSEEAITNSIAWESLFSNVPAYIAKIGGPLGQIYGYVSDGLYQYSDFDRMPNGTYFLKPNVPANQVEANRNRVQPGSPKYVDLNNDGQITSHDRTVLGNGYPLHVGGWNNNFSYKRFDVNLFFQWSYGNNIINANRLYFDQGLGIQARSSLFGGQNTFAAFADRWTPENQDTDIPRLMGVIGGYYASQFVEDGSFLRLKTLNVGYTFPASLLSRLHISSLRIYVATNNLYTWTSYKGYDPEVSAFQSGLTPSLDYSTYPRPLTVTGGINLTL